VDEAHDLALLRTKTPSAVVNIVKLCSARPADSTLIEAAALPTPTGLEPVYNTGHLTNTVLRDRDGLRRNVHRTCRKNEVRRFVQACDSALDVHQGPVGGQRRAMLRLRHGKPAGRPAMVLLHGDAQAVLKGKHLPIRGCRNLAISCATAEQLQNGQEQRKAPN